MFKRVINKIQNAGLENEVSYQNRKDLVSYNSTFLWTSVLIFINIFVAYFSGLHYVSLINVIATLSFSSLLLLNAAGLFKYSKHLGILLANIYVYFQSLAGGPDLQFQYAYCIILTLIGLIFIQKKHLFIHLSITILFFILTKLSYYRFGPWETIAIDERDYFAFNNGVIFLVLISVSAIVFRNQTNLHLSEIEQKKNMIEEKQIEIYDSINYAKRIQRAVLDNSRIIEKHLNKDKYFILFQPKDIVSGDFYWTAHVKASEAINLDGFIVNPTDELFYLAVCDSTGHGVPGAFMSLLNMGFLSESIKEQHIYEPHKIFDYVRQRLTESISSEGQKDGFDGILLCMNKTSGQITYTAANNNPVLVSGSAMQHLPADKMPVGKGEKELNFNLYHINYKPNDRLYLYTDGYPDQFGGPKGKKFKYRQLEELIALNAYKSQSEQKQILQQNFESWRGNLEQVDDVCLVGIELS